MQLPAKTSAVCRELNLPYSRLMSFIRCGKVTAPERDSSGDFWWDAAAVAQIRKAMNSPRRRKEKVGA